MVKNGENFEILAKFGQKSIGKLRSKRYVTLPVGPPPPRNVFLISGRSFAIKFLRKMTLKWSNSQKFFKFFSPAAPIGTGGKFIFNVQNVFRVSVIFLISSSLLTHFAMISETSLNVFFEIFQIIKNSKISWISIYVS